MFGVAAVSHVFTTSVVLASRRKGWPDVYVVCRAFSKVVVETWLECWGAERKPLGVEVPDMVDSRLEAIANGRAVGALN